MPDWITGIKRIFNKPVERAERPPARSATLRPASEMGPMAQWVERRIRRINYIFQTQGYSQVRLGRLIRGARHVVLPMRPSMHDIAKHTNLHQRWLNLATNIAKATGVRSYAEWDNETIYYFLELPRDFWRNYRLSELENSAIGMTEYKRMINYHFSEAYPHALVAGATGAGKSVAIENILFALIRTYTPLELGLIIIDPHHSLGARPNADAGTFTNLEHLLLPIAHTAEEITAAFQYAYQQLAHRKANGIRGRDAPRIVVVADELSNASVLGRKNSQNEPNLLIANTLAAEARKFKINLLMGAQKPEEVDNELFDHLTYRFVGRVSNNNLGTRILGRPGFKLTDLNGKGDFFVSAEKVRRFQFALPERIDFERLPRAAAPSPPLEPGPAAGLGRIPVEMPPAPQVTIVNSNGHKSKAGAKRKQTDPDKLAFYIYYGPDNITEREARYIKALQLKRSIHERHRDKARAIVTKLAELQQADIPLDLVPHLEEG